MKRLATILLLLTLNSSGQTITHGITLTCTGVAGATFNIYRTTTSGAEAKPALATGLATCSYTDPTAVVGTKYFYTATQTVGGVESAPSTEVSAQIVPPAAPTNPQTSVF